MRFVTPDVVRIELDGGDWIEVKRELTVGEEKRFRAAGLKTMSQGANGMSIDVDWDRLALARVEAYLTDWSAKKPDQKGKDVAVPVSRLAIEQLAQDDFEKIDSAIQKHIADQVELKNAKTHDELSTPLLS